MFNVVLQTKVDCLGMWEGVWNFQLLYRHHNYSICGYQVGAFSRLVLVIYDTKCQDDK